MELTLATSLDLSETVESVSLPGAPYDGSVSLDLLTVSMLVVVNPLAFKLRVIVRSLVGTVSVTDILIPISVVL